MYIDEKWKAMKTPFEPLKKNLESEQVWVSWFVGKTPVTLGVVYVSNKRFEGSRAKALEQVDLFDSITTRIEAARARGEEVLIMGDFNAHWKKMG